MGPDTCPDCAGAWRELDSNENKNADDMLGHLKFGEASPTGARTKCRNCGLLLVGLRAAERNADYCVMFGGKNAHAGNILR